METDFGKNYHLAKPVTHRNWNFIGKSTEMIRIRSYKYARVEWKCIYIGLGSCQSPCIPT